jgi:transcriptional regulator with XRE-family HTH domain
MLTTEQQERGLRVKQIREDNDIKSQAALGEKLSVSQETVSGWESGKMAISKKNLEKFRDILGVSIPWLDHGVGEMYADDTKRVVREDAPVYHKNRWGMAAITVRFAKFTRDYMSRNKLNQRQLSEDWELQESHLSAVMSGTKPVTITILIAALRHGGCNLNYVIGEMGGLYVNNDSEPGVKDMLKQLLSKMDNPAPAKKRAAG